MTPDQQTIAAHAWLRGWRMQPALPAPAQSEPRRIIYQILDNLEKSLRAVKEYHR